MTETQTPTNTVMASSISASERRVASTTSQVRDAIVSLRRELDSALQNLDAGFALSTAGAWSSGGVKLDILITRLSDQQAELNAMRWLGEHLS